MTDFQVHQPLHKITFTPDSAARMNKVAQTIFAPVYPLIAEKIATTLKPSGGTCVDIGSGPGHLSIALARITDINFYLLDKCQDMHQYALENIYQTDMQDRFCLVPGDVHHIPLEDQSIDLVISRGSIFFWDDLSRAFSEIYRILTPGGHSFIGGGFGNRSIAQKVSLQMEALKPDWKKFKEKNLNPANKARMIAVLKSLGIRFDVIDDESGFWIIMEKKKNIEEETVCWN